VCRDGGRRRGRGVCRCGGGLPLLLPTYLHTPLSLLLPPHLHTPVNFDNIMDFWGLAPGKFSHFRSLVENLLQVQLVAFNSEKEYTVTVLLE